MSQYIAILNNQLFKNNVFVQLVLERTLTLLYAEALGLQKSVLSASVAGNAATNY